MASTCYAYSAQSALHTGIKIGSCIHSTGDFKATALLEFSWQVALKLALSTVALKLAQLLCIQLHPAQVAVHTVGSELAQFCSACSPIKFGTCSCQLALGLFCILRNLTILYNGVTPEPLSHSTLGAGLSQQV